MVLKMAASNFLQLFFHCVYFFALRLIYSIFMFFSDALTSDLRKFVLAVRLHFLSRASPLFDFAPNIRHNFLTLCLILGTIF